MVKSQRKMGALLSYATQFVQILTALLYTPVMLRLLGQSEYGLYQLVFSTISYLNLLSFGFSSSYIRFYSRAKQDDDVRAVDRLNGMFMLIFSVLALICLICGGVMLWKIEAIFDQGLTVPEYALARKLMALMIINMALSFPNSVFDAFTSAKEEFIFQKLLAFLQCFLNPFFALPLLIIGSGSVGMVCVTTALTFLRLILNVGFCLKKLKMRFCFANLKFGLLKELWVFTSFIFINMIVDQVNMNIGKVLLGRFSGTVAVAVYGVANQLNSLYMQMSGSISSVYIPRVHQIEVSGGGDKEHTSLFIKIGRVQFAVLFLILTGFILFGKPFIDIWAGEGYQESYYIALLLMIPITVPLIQNIGIEIQRAKNKHKVRSYAYLIMAAFNLMISIPCIKYWGAWGAAVGTSLSYLFGNVLFMNWYYHRKIGIDVIKFWQSILKMILALIPAIVVGAGMVCLLHEWNILTIAFAIVVYTLAYVISLFCWGINDDERSAMQSVLKRVNRGRKV